MLSKSGMELNDIWAKQARLIEGNDEATRSAERNASSGDPEARERWIHQLKRSGRHAEAARAALSPYIDQFHKHQDAAVHHNAKEHTSSDIISQNHHANKSSDAAMKMDDVANDLHDLAREHGVHPHELLPQRKDEPVGHHLGRLSRFYGEWSMGHKDPDRTSFGGGDQSVFHDKDRAEGFRAAVDHHHPHLSTEIEQHTPHWSDSPRWHVFYKPKGEKKSS